jgi:hypothetical protein
MREVGSRGLLLRTETTKESQISHHHYRRGLCTYCINSLKILYDFEKIRQLAFTYQELA